MQLQTAEATCETVDSKVLTAHCLASPVQVVAVVVVPPLLTVEMDKVEPDAVLDKGDLVVTVLDDEWETVVAGFVEEDADLVVVVVSVGKRAERHFRPRPVFKLRLVGPALTVVVTVAVTVEVAVVTVLTVLVDVEVDVKVVVGFSVIVDVVVEVTVELEVAVDVVTVVVMVAVLEVTITVLFAALFARH